MIFTLIVVCCDVCVVFLAVRLLCFFLSSTHRLARADVRREEDFAYLWTSHVVSRSYRAPELFLSRDLSVDAKDEVSRPSSPQPSYSDASPSSVIPDVCSVPGTPPSAYPPFSSYSPAIDVWSAGAVFAETLTGRVLIPGGLSVKDQLLAVLRFSGTPERSQWWEGGGVATETMKRYLQSLPFFPSMDKRGCFPGVSDEGTYLLERLLAFDPRDRPTAAEALRYPYFNSVRHEYAVRPGPVALNPADFEFELRPRSADEPAKLRREILEEIKEFQRIRGNGPGGLGASPEKLREPPSLVHSMPAPPTHDGEAAQEVKDQRLNRGILTLPGQVKAMRLDGEPPPSRPLCLGGEAVTPPLGGRDSSSRAPPPPSLLPSPSTPARAWDASGSISPPQRLVGGRGRHCP